jgi:hypothetical protein
MLVMQTKYVNNLYRFHKLCLLFCMLAIQSLQQRENHELQASETRPKTNITAQSENYYIIMHFKIYNSNSTMVVTVEGYVLNN